MNKGNYYKLKTRKWFIEKGYDCEIIEKLMRIISKGKTIFVKKDIFGADGVAMNKSEIIFWNSKFGKKNIAEGMKEFLKYQYPPFVERWLVIWQEREKEPEIIEG